MYAYPQTLSPYVLSVKSNIKTPGTPQYTQPGGAGYKPPVSSLSGGTAGGGDINSIVASMQAAQDKANAANETRYTQGLDVLNQAKTAALKANQGVGQSQLAEINRGETQGLAQSDQDAINRGIGNTTIRSALQSQVKRRANDARQTANEGIAQRNSQLQLQASNPIADAIFARNDNGPDMSQAASILAAIASGRAKLGG